MVANSSPAALEELVDGPQTLDDEDLAAHARDKAREAMGRQRAWLGREMLTWLLWKSNSGDPLIEYEGEEVLVMLTGAVTLQGVAGDATELRAKGHQAAYADVVRQALARGLLVHQAGLRWVVGDIDSSRIFEATIDAEHFGFRQVRLPKVLSDDPDEAFAERLFLLDQLGEIFEHVWEKFVEVRSSPEWLTDVVPALRAWMSDDTP